MSWFWCNYTHMCIKYFQHAVIFIPEVFWMGGKKSMLIHSFMAVIITLINVITINCQDTRPSFRLQLVTAHICWNFFTKIPSQKLFSWKCKQRHKHKFIQPVNQFFSSDCCCWGASTQETIIFMSTGPHCGRWWWLLMVTDPENDMGLTGQVGLTITAKF